MLELSEVNQIISQAATETLKHPVVSVTSTPFKDYFGDPALRVRIVIADEYADALPEKSLDLLVRSHNELLDRGDSRFPFLRYATETDLLIPDD